MNTRPGQLDDVVSALVILRPAGGDLPTDQITAENVRRLAPSAEAVDEVTDWLRERGFEVGPVVGFSFAVTGPRSLLADLQLPDRVAQHVASVVFPDPPDFGPGNP